MRPPGARAGWEWLPALGTIGVFAVLGWAQLGRPLVMDEAEFARVAVDWAQGAPAREGLWHTPLYLESLTLWQKIWGVADLSTGKAPVLRAFGLMCWILAAGVVARWLRREKGIQPAQLAPWLALLLWHPYAVQSGLLLDIDNTVLIPLLALWVVLADRWFRSPRASWGLSGAMGLVLGIALMAKLVTPLFGLPVWGMLALVRAWERRGEPGQMRRELLTAVAGMALAALVFAAMLLAWAAWRGVHWSAPLQILLGRMQSGEGARSWFQFPGSKLFFIQYVPFLWIGLPAAAWTIARSIRGTPTLARVPAALVFAAFAWAVYMKVMQMAYYFPKYTAIVWPCLVLAAASAKAEAGFALPAKRATWILAAALFGIGLVPALDPLRLVEFRRELGTGVALTHLLALITPLLLLAGLAIIEGSSNRARAWAFGLLALLLGASVGQATRGHSTGYAYGEEGQLQALRRARQLLEVAQPRRLLTSEVDLWIVTRPDADHRPGTLQPDPEILERTGVALYRSYSETSFASQPGWLGLLEAKFPCSETVAAPGGRFLLRWRPKSGRCGPS